MTGLDRLHEIAEDVGRTVWLRDLGAALHKTLEVIARETEDISGYESDVLAWVEENGGLDSVKERLMPEDMSWPRYAGGSPVEIGDDVVGPYYGERIHVDEVVFHANGFTLRSKGGDGKWYESDDRFERPAVLAADGKPLEVGQTVYLPDGTLLHVTGIGDMTEGHQTVFGKAGNDIIDDEWDAVLLTHQRPVLDADGVPIDEGDTVWNATTSAGPFTVREIERSDDPDEPEDIVWCGERAANGFKVWRIADQLTHTNPEIDTWQRIEEDVDALVDAEDNGVGSFSVANDYCERHGLENGTVWVMMARDLVRRCREVAERERGE